MTDTTATLTPFWDGHRLPAGIMFFPKDDGPLEKRRLMLTIDIEEAWAFDDLPEGQSATATTMIDHTTGERFLVARAACGLGCYCGAVARWTGDL